MAALAGMTMAAVAEGPPLYAQLLERLRRLDDVVPSLPGYFPTAPVYNREAPIPPQCYTRTEGRHNPCYVCHQSARDDHENLMDDGGLQIAYAFSELGERNHWSNLFEDRTARVEAISDVEIDQWVATDNYSGLPERLRAARFAGWIPDLQGLQEGAAAFDADGFARDGSGWVAFNYKPVPSTFWPTNGSTDDVMVRLPEVYRRDRQNRPSRDAYRANLALLEASLKALPEVSVGPVDERLLGDDVDGDGQLGIATKAVQRGHWVGAAHDYLFYAGLYPLDTEFLHTVRYVGVQGDGDIVPSRRMKEVRYMRKWTTMPVFQLAEWYDREKNEKVKGNLPSYRWMGDRGLDNGMAWFVQGFIEARDGRLRSLTVEENLACMGCHTSIGATHDKTFSFVRKPDGANGWGYIDLKKLQDVPLVGEKDGEYLNYFRRAGGGDEFRSNQEMLARWFDASGVVDEQRVRGAPDLYTLITPSAERARLLNKAYRTIVADQDYLFGKDAMVSPPKNVYAGIDPETAPVLPGTALVRTTLRPDWGQVSPARR